jgi:hypothetical protein
MRLIRCNRCGAEAETPMPKQNLLFGLMAPAKIPSWSRVRVEETPAEEGVMGRGETADLCEDCVEVFLLQFMKGAAIAPITQPLAQVAFPHQLMTDCQLVWNPGKGGLLCYHDDPELYHALILDNAQNVAEGVPEQPVSVDVSDAIVSCPVCKEKVRKSVRAEHIVEVHGNEQELHGCSECGGRVPGFAMMDHYNTVHNQGDTKLQRKIEQIRQDMITAGVAHSVVQRCTEACSEAHTYKYGCLLASPAIKAQGSGLPVPPTADDLDQLAYGVPEQWKGDHDRGE